MYESPSNLQDFCLDYICDNVDALCEDQTDVDTGATTLVFKNGDIFFPSHLSEQLLSTLCDKKKLSDKTLTLFDANVANLKRVRIKNAPLSLQALKILKSHKIVDLQASGLKKVSVNDLIGCLSPWTISNLRSLNVANSTFINSSRYCVSVSLQTLKNLQTLNVSYTEFNELGLKIIAQELCALEVLDISVTNIGDISPLRRCHKNLKSLSMFNLKYSNPDQAVETVSELRALRHLDISSDFSLLAPSDSGEPDLSALLRRDHVLPALESLDLSGRDVDDVVLTRFITTHPKLRFIGALFTSLTDSKVLIDSDHVLYCKDRKVSGETNEGQLVEALKRYCTRPKFVQRSLYHLFNFTQGYTEPRLDIIQLVLPAMRAQPQVLGVQMAATACLYNLSKVEMGSKIHPKWLAQIVYLTLDAMENFPRHRQLQKNALLTLCSDRILQDVTFDRYRCAELVMECLCSFDDQSMTRMSVAICGILAAKIPTEQTSRLGAKSAYMSKLLKIVKEKTQVKSIDITMRFTLSALWNLTDEAPITCEMFLTNGGLKLFLEVLETYKEEPDQTRVQVETKVLGLVNNVAEVSRLRPQLMNDAVLQTVKELLHSSHIDVSYFAAGIMSHLISDPAFSWDEINLAKHEILSDLETVVLKWKQPDGEMVAYRSFCPFFPLLQRFDLPQVQLWSVWAIQHVCTKNSERYCRMLINEGGADLLTDLINNVHAYPEVVKLAGSVIEIIERQLGHPLAGVRPMDM